MIDLIGDIHGHATELEALLTKLGYTKINGVFTHPTRKVLFVGDYIDRGPKIRETLEIVKAMTDHGEATALMGNHEYNALCFHFQESEGGHLRKHLIKNIIQHYETLRQFQNRQKEYEEYLDWFKSLPLFYENNEFRAVHACWDADNIELLKISLDENKLTDDLIYQSVKKESSIHTAIEETLKGKEIQLPEGIQFTDKDGNKRDEIRIKWWENTSQMTYRTLSIEQSESIPNEPINQTGAITGKYYPAQDKPVFFGHYWLKGEPVLFKENICCLDFSVAKGGKLVAYRFNGETKLKPGNFIYV